VLACLCIACVAFADAKSVTLHYQIINNFPVKYVAVDMNDPEVRVTTAVAPSFPYGLEGWGSFMSRLRPTAAINGTYFCTRSYQPVGDIATNGALLYRGSVGTALCITPDNHVDLLPGPRQAKSNWAGYSTVLCAGPRLLEDAQLSLHARDEGFRDPRVLGSAPRSAIALRSDGVLLLMTIERNISLPNLAFLCQKLGARQAMALDGGSSSGLYINGYHATRPSRSISNIIAVYATPQQYSSVLDRLVAPRRPILARLLPEAPLVTQVLQMASKVVPEPVFVIPPARQPAAVPPTTVSSMVQFIEPDAKLPVKGIIPVSAKVSQAPQMAWCSLRINGQLRAMSSTTSLEYLWDSTKETDGPHTLEISVWARDQRLITAESRLVLVRNTTQIAGN
jgi:hypothetical protein